MRNASSKSDFDEISDDPVNIITPGWKESDFMVFKEFGGFDPKGHPDWFVFEFRLTNPNHPELPNFTLCEDGEFSNIQLVELTHVEMRIKGIKLNGGIPDESLKALEEYQRQKAEFDAKTGLYTPEFPIPG